MGVSEYSRADSRGLGGWDLVAVGDTATLLAGML